MNNIVETYLGDAVYAEWDGFHITLTVSYGEGDVHTIHLDPHVVDRLARFIGEVRRSTIQQMKKRRGEEDG